MGQIILGHITPGRDRETIGVIKALVGEKNAQLLLGKYDFIVKIDDGEFEEKAEHMKDLREVSIKKVLPYTGAELKNS